MRLGTDFYSKFERIKISQTGCTCMTPKKIDRYVDGSDTSALGQCFLRWFKGGNYSSESFLMNISVLRVHNAFFVTGIDVKLACLPGENPLNFMTFSAFEDLVHYKDWK